MRYRTVLVPGLIIMSIGLVVSGCKTFSMPFIHTKADFAKVPADDLYQAALDIEQAVQTGEREPVLQNRAGIVIDTERIRQAVKMRAARSALVNEFRTSGYGCEKRNGLIAIERSKEYSKATTRRERDRNALLILNENGDRWALYEGIVKESNFPSGALSAVQETFFRARLECMEEGQPYESDSGETLTKSR